MIQTHLLDDWLGRTPYVRTISLALVTWQPWMSRMPGCAFVEESGEAMLSRMASALRRQPHIIDFRGRWTCG